MAVIKLTGLDFAAYHGVYAAERTNGNRFTVDIEFEADTTAAQQNDKLEDTVDYSAIYTLIAAEMAKPSNLLEHVGQRIKTAIQSNLKGIRNLQVAVTKHNPPVEGKVEKVTVIV